MPSNRCSSSRLAVGENSQFTEVSFTEFKLKTRYLRLNTMFKWSVFYTEPFWEKKSFYHIYFSFDFESNIIKGHRRVLYGNMAFCFCLLSLIHKPILK